MTDSTISTELEAAISAELGHADASPEEQLAAAERVYAKQGEAPFDPLNPADAMIRAFVLAEAVGPR